MFQHHPKAFLIIQTAFIGDVILATSLVENLHAAYPDAGIDFLLRKGNEALFEGHPHIRTVFTLDKKKDKYRNIWQLWKGIRQQQYDAVINVHRFAVTGFLAAFSGAKHIAGFDKNPFSQLFDHRAPHILGGGIHETTRNHQLLKGLVNAPVCRPALYPSAADFARVSSLKQTPYLCIAPASVWYTKQYPANRWIDFLRSPANTGKKVYFLGGEEDKRLVDDLLRQCPEVDGLNLAGTLTILQSAALMKDAQMNYVNDSSPMHIASAMNAPVVAIFCSTVPDFGFGPLSDRAYVVETHEHLICRPCGIHGHHSCPKGHFACAMGIQTEQLMV
ncbi:MAG TPA: heptosyltransferase [Saprospirales bacterium]|nr:heptosyltransferase [Saprospirales bacterium]